MEFSLFGLSPLLSFDIYQYIKATGGKNERDNSPSRRDAIWQIVGHRNCRVRGTSRTRRPLSENQRAIRGRRRAVLFSLLASILVSMDIISSHRRIMPRHTRVCPRETKEEASFCFHGHHGMRASSCASLIFARTPWLFVLLLTRIFLPRERLRGIKIVIQAWTFFQRFRRIELMKSETSLSVF